MRTLKVPALFAFVLLIGVTVSAFGSDKDPGSDPDEQWRDHHESMYGDFITDGDISSDHFVTPPFEPGERLLPLNEDIVDMIEQVEESTALAYIEDLVAFGPRVTETPAMDEAADYIYDTFAGMGLEVDYHYWSYSGYDGTNVEATLPGKDPESDEIYIVCGHYDSVVGSPGADDNASGTAAVLVCAEIMSRYAFDHTIRFVAFSGEEQGLLGSHVYAQEASQNGDNIVAVLNGDMLGYAEDDYDRTHMNVFYDDNSYWIMSFIDATAEEYYDMINLDIIPAGYTWGSDHYSFWEYGYEAVFCHEYEFNPYWHEPQDVIDNMDMLYEMRNCRLILASLAELAVPAPLPDVKANGSDTPISIPRSETLSVTAKLNDGGVSSTADWWLVGRTPLGWFSYDIGQEWLPGIDVTYQGALFDLPVQQVLNMAHLPVGSYTFYFGVDMLMNGGFDFGEAYIDSVQVTVTQ